ncbi:MAG: hypothetical protein K6U07_05995 [Firmicutes bacterium]|nr:hypothetical protein [Bacillota bacterium]
MGRWLAGVLGAAVAVAAAHGAAPPTSAAVRNLIESFIGAGTVASVYLDASGREVDVHVRMDGVRALPADRGDWGWFFRDVSEIATSRVFSPPLAHEGLRRLVRVRLWYRLGGRLVARAARDRGQALSWVVLVP